MSENKEWRAKEGHAPHHQGQVADDATGKTIAVAYQDEDGSNARLLAAAPDLLRGCQMAIAYLTDPRSKYATNRKEAARSIEAAVFKATRDL